MISTPIGAGLCSPAILIFNRSIRALLPQINREPININADNEHYKALKYIKINTLRAMTLAKNHFLLLQGLQ